MTNAHGNNDHRLTDLQKELTKYGEACAAGANARPAAAVSLCQASHDGFVTPADAKHLWDEFQRGMAKRKGIEYKQESSFKVQVSKAKTFLVLGALPIDGPGVLQRSMDVIQELAADEANPMRGSAYDNMVKIAREQKNLYESGDERELTDDEIRGHLIPVPKEKDELASLTAIARNIEKTLTGNKDTGEGKYPSPQLEAALDQVANRINELNAIKEKQEAEAKMSVLSDQDIAAYVATRSAGDACATPAE